MYAFLSTSLHSSKRNNMVIIFLRADIVFQFFELFGSFQWHKIDVTCHLFSHFIQFQCSSLIRWVVVWFMFVSNDNNKNKWVLWFPFNFHLFQRRKQNPWQIESHQNFFFENAFIFVSHWCKMNDAQQTTFIHSIWHCKLTDINRQKWQKYKCRRPHDFMFSFFSRLKSGIDGLFVLLAYNYRKRTYTAWCVTESATECAINGHQKSTSFADIELESQSHLTNS